MRSRRPIPKWPARPTSQTAVADDLVPVLRQRLLAGDAVDFAAAVSAGIDELRPLLGAPARAALASRTLDELFGLGPLQALVSDPDVTEVMVNGGGEIWVDRTGSPVLAGRIEATLLDTIVERIVSPLGLRLDRSSPIVDARLPDGSRVCAIRSPLAVDGTCLSIRRFRTRTITLDDFAPSPVATVVRQLVRSRCNVVVSGAASAGKTTLLNALGSAVDPSARIITIEDTAELCLDAPHVLRLEGRTATADGLGEIGIETLLRAALRLRPDRLVIGEVRGGEAAALIQAMNTGHDGSLATVHANGPADALRRLESMVLLGAPNWPLSAIREQIHSAIDAVIHVGRRGGLRRIESVAEVLPDPTAEGRVTLLTDHSAALAGITRARTR
jgi:pilus assembly protein CpaF